MPYLNGLCYFNAIFDISMVQSNEDFQICLQREGVATGYWLCQIYHISFLVPNIEQEMAFAIFGMANSTPLKHNILGGMLNYSIGTRYSTRVELL